MTFCDVFLSWESDSAISQITSFTFKEVGTDYERLDHFATDSDHDSDFQLQSKTPVLVSKGNKEDAQKNCEMRLKCRNPVSSRINGLVIVSESKLIEVSNDLEGYMTSIRGKRLHGDEDAEDSQPKLFACKCFFPEKYTTLTVKFLSLGDRTSFSLHNLTINISQIAGSGRVPLPGSFDLDKLVRNIEEMGDTVSFRAKDFLTTLEHYKQNMESERSKFLEWEHAVENAANDDEKLKELIPGFGVLSEKANLNENLPNAGGHLGGSDPVSAPGPEVFSTISRVLQNPVFLAAKRNAMAGVTDPSMMGDGPDSNYAKMTSQQIMAELGVDEGALREARAYAQQYLKKANSDEYKSKVTEIQDNMQKGFETVVKKLDEHNQQLTQKLEESRHSLVSRLEAQKADFDKKFDMMEQLLQQTIDMLEEIKEVKREEMLEHLEDSGTS